jgi:LmbE family N-acetylglucosaminyl deacetylase
VKNVLWVGAHPDDEAYAAPLLYDLCSRVGVHCTFLVVTDGGKGHCVLGAGACGATDKGGMPAGSVGAFRLQEMQDAVAYFGGQLVALGLEDTPSSVVGGVAQNWNQTYSGTPNDTQVDRITQKIAQAITQSSADVIVTFDPRHGVYCHPDHRAVGALTLVAAQGLGFDFDRILMVELAEVYVDASGGVTQRAWVPRDPSLVHYDVEAAGTWPARAADYGFHKSQYTAAELALFATIAPAARSLPLLQVGKVIAGGKLKRDPQYDTLCATEDTPAGWDGHGVCPKADGGVGYCW